MRPTTVAELAEAALDEDAGDYVATSVFWIHHGTRLAGGDTTYLNQYVLVRSGDAFGACAIEEGELGPEIGREYSGATLESLIRQRLLPLRVAALDAYLARRSPHRTSSAEPVVLPEGGPEQRARARDAAIAGLLGIEPGAKVALIGVVNPLVTAIRERGGHCLPCDLNLRMTQWGDEITDSSDEVLAVADTAVVTGMTLGNGSFDHILSICRKRGIPLIVYGQTGSAVAREFLHSGVSAVCAEPFPFSQFSAEPTTLYRYRGGS